MHSIFALGGSPLKKSLFEKKPVEQNTAKASQKIPQHPTLVAPNPPQSLLTHRQAQAAKTLTFGARGSTIAPNVKLESDFIRLLKTSKDSTEKAGVADLLGRARSVNAMPNLLKLLSEKEDIDVRTAAAGALANIGTTTHKNSYTATMLTNALLDSYEKRKAAVAEWMDNSVELPYEDKIKEKENREKMLNELNTLAKGVSRLNTLQGKKALQTEYVKTLAMTQLSEDTLSEMVRLTDLAQDEFHKELSKRFQKPIKEVLREIPKHDLEEMKKKVIIKTPDGQTMNLLEALLQIAMMQEQHEQFNCQLMLGLMDALAGYNDREANASIKLALDSNHPEIKARSLEILSDRNMLNYSSDIYPNLHSRDTEVREASVKALLASPESAAKQKTMELMSPDAFFDLIGGFNRETLGQYVDFMENIAAKGDEFVQALSNQALHSEYDVETRQIALMTLSMMVTDPINKGLMPETLIQAANTIKIMALSPPARKPDEQDTLRLTATQMWVQMKDPNAIAAAILLADSKEHRLSGKDQERLLATVLSVLHEDSLKKSKESNQNQKAHTLLDIMRSSKDPLLTEKAETEILSKLKPERVSARVNPKSVDDFIEENEDLELDIKLAEKLGPSLEELHPALTRLAETEKSDKAQMMAFRIMGLLKDTEGIKYLVDRVRDPLKGKIDWEADVSYRGNPSITAANMRLNALAALGDIGDAKALDVMTDTLDDPVLRGYVTEPLKKIAEDANAKASEPKLTKVRNKLVRLMSDPNTTRAMRATRIGAANTLYKFNGGVDAIKKFVAETENPNFKRHALSALLSNNYGVEEDHPDHDLVKDMIYPGLGVDKLHAKGITGKGVEMAIIDGGFVDPTNEEGFQNRVKVPANFEEPEHYHPTMVMSTAAGNGKLKGVAPDATVYSDRWPDFDSKDPMDTYKKIIEGKLRGENNIRVINNSWGFSDQNSIIHKDVRTILKEFKNVVDLAEKAGIQIVFAAGNEGEEPGFPKLGTLSLFGVDVDKLTGEDKKTMDYILDKVVLVGAVNTQGSDKRTDHRLAEFSSVGDSLNRKLTPTVIAPGVDMMVYGWDKHKGNPKELVNGTSFASPYVTGLIGLMVQANPKLTPADIRDILKKTSVKLQGVPISQQGHGEVVPDAAVKMAKTYGSAPTRGKGGGIIPKPPTGPAGGGSGKPSSTSASDQQSSHMDIENTGSGDESSISPPAGDTSKKRARASDDISMQESGSLSGHKRRRTELEDDGPQSFPLFTAGRKRLHSEVQKEESDLQEFARFPSADGIVLPNGKVRRVDDSTATFSTPSFDFNPGFSQQGFGQPSEGRGLEAFLSQPSTSSFSISGKFKPTPVPLKQTPSKPSRNVLMRTPAVAPRMKPPSTPSLVIIR
jgi:subtilisin family serine protease/predicted HTH domain antitoxin